MAELNAQRSGTLDGLSSTSNVSSENRPPESKVSLQGREFDPFRVGHNLFLSQPMEQFSDDTLRPGMVAAGFSRADEPSRIGLSSGTEKVVAPEDHGHASDGESSSREVSDADEEEAPPLATPQKAAADEGDFD